MIYWLKKDKITTATTTTNNNKKTKRRKQTKGKEGMFFCNNYLYLYIILY